MLNWRLKYTRVADMDERMDQVFIVTADGARMDSKGCESSKDLSSQFVWGDLLILLVTIATITVTTTDILIESNNKQKDFV